MSSAPPVDLVAVVLTALLNPAVILVALWMGRKADQPQKLPLAAFAAAAAGSALASVAVWMGVSGIRQVGRAAAGLFIVQFVFGLAWAYVGHRFLPR